MVKFIQGASLIEAARAYVRGSGAEPSRLGIAIAGPEDIADVERPDVSRSRGRFVSFIPSVQWMRRCMG